MGIEVVLDIFVKEQHVANYKTAAQDVLGDEPDSKELDGGVVFGYGDINIDRYHDLVENLKIDQVPCTLFVSNSSDPSIEDFTTEIKEVDGVWIADECSKSGQREKEALLDVLEKINLGESPEQIKAYIEEKIKKIC